MDTILVTILLCCICINIGICEEPPSKKLYKDLLSDYIPDVLPCKGCNGLKDGIEVKFGIALQAIHQVDVHNSRLVTLLWLNEEWRDFQLEWNERNYNGVKSIRIGQDKIWMPDIRLYNSEGENKPYDTHVVVYSDGTCSVVPVVEMTSSCYYDLRWFPHDTQICTLKFGSWTYDGTKVNLTSLNDQIDISTYTPHPGWELMKVPAHRHVAEYECCPQPYIDITFEIHLKRRDLCSYQYVSPAVLIALLTPFIFLLPTNSSAKFVLGGTMLICVTLLIHMLNDILPAEHNTKAVIGVYYDMIFALLVISMALSTIVNNIADRVTKGCAPPQHFIRVIMLNCLGRVLCVPYDQQYGSPTGTEMEDERQRITDNQAQAVVTQVNEWRLIATVLDRLFFVVFICFVIIFTMGTFLSMPL